MRGRIACVEEAIQKAQWSYGVQPIVEQIAHIRLQIDQILSVQVVQRDVDEILRLIVDFPRGLVHFCGNKDAGQGVFMEFPILHATARSQQTVQESNGCVKRQILKVQGSRYFRHPFDGMNAIAFGEVTLEGLVGQNQAQIGPLTLLLVNPAKLFAEILAVCVQEGYGERLLGIVITLVRTTSGLATRRAGVDVGKVLFRGCT